MKTNLILLIQLLLVCSFNYATTFTVTTTTDDGPGSLRQAIVDANQHVGNDYINFNISGTGPHVIMVLSQLPDVTEAVTIDGFSQNGSVPASFTSPASYMIILDGISTDNQIGINLGGDNIYIRGLKIQNFNYAIDIAGNANHLEGNYLVDSKADAVILTGQNNVIGGADPDQRNVISGYNSTGVVVFPGSNDNVILGNYIGTDPTGEFDDTNGWDGISISGNFNRVGGYNPGEGNVIGGNENQGILIGYWDNLPDRNSIYGNYIGTNKTGTNPIANGQGISINNAQSISIGYNFPGAGNVIAGNTFSGILIDGELTENMKIKGNLIGVQPDGLTALSNGEGGIYVERANNTLIGGINEADWNVIAYNGWGGVIIRNGTGNSVYGNSIFNNQGLGIDLGPNGVNENDEGDLDGGPNNMMNFPVLTKVLSSNDNSLVKGFIDSEDPKTVLIHFYANEIPSPGADPSGYGEGQIYMGSINPNKHGDFSVSFLPLPDGTVISASATDANGNTSEFCESVEAEFPKSKSASLKNKISELHLADNYPNPFNSCTTIKFYVPSENKCRLIILDSTGRLIYTLVNNVLEKGSYSCKWEGSDRDGNLMPSGLYLYQLKVGNKIITKKMQLIK